MQLILDEMKVLWADVMVIQNNTDVNFFNYEYQSANVSQQNSQNSNVAQAVDPPANLCSAGEVAPPAVSGNNQIPPSSKRRLEVSADSQNSSLTDEENFQLVS